jgi:hypothetical protein
VIKKESALESWALSSSHRETLHPSYIIAWLTLEKFYSKVKLRSPEQSRIPTPFGMQLKQTGIYQVQTPNANHNTLAHVLAGCWTGSPVAPHNV